MEHTDETRNGNYITRTYQEDSPECPRSWDNLGTMVCFHNRYNLGDKHDYNSNDYNGWDEMEKDIIKRENVGVILPLYLYDHSGITMNTTGFSCRFDSGQVGFIFVNEKKCKEMGWTNIKYSKLILVTRVVNTKKSWIVVGGFMVKKIV